MGSWARVWEMDMLKKLTGIAMAMGLAVVAMASMIEAAPPRATTMATLTTASR
ncbi:hypothetical protein BH10PSE6_BH10PSE6_51610 [soil metagenome]